MLIPVLRGNFKEYTFTLLMFAVMGGIGVSAISSILGAMFGITVDTAMLEEVTVSAKLLEWFVESLIGAIIPPIAALLYERAKTT